MSDQLQHLFVYGTLKPGHGNYRRIESHVHSARPGTIQGILIDCGAFPALLHGEGIVKGMVLKVDAEALRITDFIEGYHPDSGHSLYTRDEVQVNLDDGETIAAWTYFYANPDHIHDRPRLEVGRLGDTPIFEWQGKIEMEP